MNLETLNRYHEEGWLIKQTHPTLPLTIWNYSQKTQYEGYWDEVTISCRGLVTDDIGNIVARPFKKFWNLEEGKHRPTEKYDVFMKMDGSLISAFYFQGGWIFASRGSFTSDQALAASKLFHREYGSTGMNVDTTYLLEFTAPWNRIVVDYGDKESLTLLGGIRTEDGVEVPWQHLDTVARLNEIPLVQKFDAIEDYTKLKQRIYDDEEGFVVRFSNGDRMKIKGEEYIRLHRIMTNVSTTSVWEYVSKGQGLEDLIDNVPDEFFDKIKNYENNLFMQYAGYELEIRTIFTNIAYSLDTTSRKDFAIEVQKQLKDYRGILFRMYEGREYSDLLWKLIKPEFQKL